MGARCHHSVPVFLERPGKLSDVLEIVADVHERASGIPSTLERLGAHVTIRSLTRGDYVLGPGSLVERKTTTDLHLTVQRGRFWNQMYKLRGASQPVLLVEGRSLWLSSEGLPRDAVRGVLLTVANLGVCVIRSEDAADSAAWLIRLAKRNAGTVRVDRPVYAQGPRRHPGTTPAEQALAAAPGVSAVTARSLLRRFGSLYAVVSATTMEHEAVAGVGPVRAEALRSMIHDPWRATGTS
jgi:ERCC4-type nuclease